MIAATVVAIDGLISMSRRMTILVGLLGRTYDSTVGFDVLVSKNLVYFFGHTIANLTHLPRRRRRSTCCCPATPAVPTR